MSLAAEPRQKMKEPSLHGCAAILCGLTLLGLIGFAVTRHPESMQGGGSDLLRMDGLLVLLYSAAGTWVWYQSRPDLMAVLGAGARVGFGLATVLAANHIIELFVLQRPFFVIIAPVLLTLALLGAAGSAAWERTRSVLLSMLAGFWGAILAILIFLCIAFCLNLLLQTRAELPLQQPFAASGMKDPGGFLVRNMLEAASEELTHMPILALFLSLTGALARAWLDRLAPRHALAALLVTPFLFVAGAMALWHANSLARAARPPFVLCGVLLAGVALCSAHALWSTLRPLTDAGQKSDALPG